MTDAELQQIRDRCLNDTSFGSYGACQDTAALLAEVERLRAALQPFAEHAESWCKDPPVDGETIVSWKFDAAITLNHCRRAREVLQS